MNESYTRLIAGLPQSGSTALDVRAQRVAIQDLPLANPQQATRQLGQMLDDMAGKRSDGRERLGLLQDLRPAVSALVEGLERRVTADTYPLPRATETAAESVLALQVAYAEGFALAVHELCAPAGRAPMLKVRSVALALVYCAQELAAAQFIAYRLHRMPPQGLWQRLHDVYRFARAIKVHARAVEDPYWQGAHVDVRAAYLHALLMALSNPYRLRGDEMSSAQQITRCLAPYCQLGTGLAGEDVFAVQTEADCGPGYLLEEREDAGNDLLALDVGPALEFLREHVGWLPKGAEQVNLHPRGARAVAFSRSFAEALCRAWVGSVQRDHDRIEAQHSLDTATGLHSLHFYLAGERDFESFMRHVGGIAITLGDNENAAAWLSGNESARPRLPVARVVDQSLGGYRLLWASAQSMRVKIGELVGMATPEDEPGERQWSIGVVRWLRTGTDGALDVGVQLLARRAQAAGVRALDADGQPTQAMRGVLLRNDDGDSPELVVTRLFDRRADALELTMTADPRVWGSSSRVKTVQIADTRDVSSAYIALQLPADALAEHSWGEQKTAGQKTVSTSG